MNALILDAGALISLDRGDRAMRSRIEAAQEAGLELRTTAIVVAQAWRSSDGRQARLARALRTIEIRSVDATLGLRAGVLLGRAGTDDPIDATVVLAADDGDVIVTTDPGDIAHLAGVAGRLVTIVPC